MERFRSSFKKGGGSIATAAAGKSAPPATGKFKLRVAKDPLPLLTKKESNRGMKPIPKFLKAAGSTEKQNGTTKAGLFAANSSIRPSATKDLSKMRTGFSFTKFQPKFSEPKKIYGNALGKGVPQVFADSKPKLSKFSVKGLSTESSNLVDKGPLLKPPAKGGLPAFAFRAETKSSTAKKRKAVDLSTQGGRSTPFPNKSGRVESTGGMKLKSFSLNKEKGLERLAGNSGVFNNDTQPKRLRKGTFSLATKKGSAMVKETQNDGVGLKKRGLIFPSAELGPAPKRSKQAAAAQPRDTVVTLDNEAVESRGFPRDVAPENENAELVPQVPLGFGTAQTPVGGAKSPHSCVAVPRSPDHQEEWYDSVAVPRSPHHQEECGLEDEVAIKLLCTLDDDQDDDFLIRLAAIEEFTDRVGLEQKKIHKRLLDAHADVSETLLDALTGLMAEEGGIGIDKLDYMNLDVDVGDAFLQDDVTLLLE